MKGSLQYRPADRTIELSFQPIDDALLMKLMSAVQSCDYIILIEIFKADRAFLLVEGLPVGHLSVVSLLRSVNVSIGCGHIRRCSVFHLAIINESIIRLPVEGLARVFAAAGAA